MALFTENQLKKINKTALAEKHNCTPKYVGMVLREVRPANTIKAQAIVKSANDILQILE